MCQHNKTMKFFISKNKKLPRAAQKGLLPREEFMTKGKDRFLAVFDASPLARNARAAGVHARPAYVTAFFKIGIGVTAVLFVGVGLSAYADTANVAATNPLYPLKRISENVRLALAPAALKPQLEATFAVRRANEVVALQASAPSSTLIPALTDDMQQDISASLGVAPARVTAAVVAGPMSAVGAMPASGTGYYGAHVGRIRSVIHGGTAAITTTTAISSTATVSESASVGISSTVNTGTIDVYCSAFDESTSGVLIGHLEDNLSLRPGALEQFNKQCGNATSTNGASAAASATVEVHARVIPLR